MCLQFIYFLPYYPGNQHLKNQVKRKIILKTHHTKKGHTDFLVHLWYTVHLSISYFNFFLQSFKNLVYYYIELMLQVKSRERRTDIHFKRESAFFHK